MELKDTHEFIVRLTRSERRSLVRKHARETMATGHAQTLDEFEPSVPFETMPQYRGNQLIFPDEDIPSVYWEEDLPTIEWLGEQ